MELLIAPNNVPNMYVVNVGSIAGRVKGDEENAKLCARESLPQEQCVNIGFASVEQGLSNAHDQMFAL